MKKIFLIGICIVIAGSSMAQWLTQSDGGKGTFLFKGSNISFEPAKTDLSFTLNNLINPAKFSADSDKFLLFYGGGLNAGTEEGLKNFFSGKKLTPYAGAHAYGGFQFANSFNKLYQAEDTRLSAQVTKIKNQQSDEFINRISSKIDEEILSSALSDSVIIKRVKKDWKETLRKSQPKSFFDYLRSYKPDNVSVANIIPDVLEEIETIVKENAENLDHIRNLLAENREDIVQKKLWRLSFFAFGGISASSFKRVREIDTFNLSESFIREDYRGFNIGAGINYQINRWKFGSTYSFRQTNNFDLLDETDYKFTSVIASGGQILTQEKTTTAYSGVYGEVEINELNADIIYTLSLGNSSGASALLNAYFRGRYYSRNEELLSNDYNVGIGSYFYTKKSRFLGGFYIELPDINNSYKNNNPAVTQHIKANISRLSFGVAGKYSLNALISRQ